MIFLIFALTLLGLAFGDSNHHKRQQAEQPVWPNGPHVSQPDRPVADHLNDYEDAGYFQNGYNGYGSYGTHNLRCTCAVIGPDDDVKRALENWLPKGNGGFCSGSACYRADFVGYSYQHGNRPSHYTVLACYDIGTHYGALVYKVHQNTSISQVIPNTYAREHMRYILELKCAHASCQDMGVAHWGPEEYMNKVRDYHYHSGAFRPQQALGISISFIIATILYF